MKIFSIMIAPETLSEAISILKEDGYTEDMNLQSNCVECKNLDLKIHPNDFVVDKFYRFEGDSSAEDEEVVYAISSDKYKIKGILVDAYGKDSDAMSAEIMEKLKMNR